MRNKGLIGTVKHFFLNEQGWSSGHLHLCERAGHPRIYMRA